MSHHDYSDEEWYDDQNAAVEHAEINSPRLLIACRKQGIQPHELLKKSIPEIREIYKKDKLTKAGIMLAAQHYEERRQEKLRIVLKERARIINDEQEWAHVPYNQKRSDLHLAKGRTTQASPKDNEAKRRKERRQLGEMLIKQQEEMDEFIMNEDNYLKDQGDFPQRVAFTRAKESQLREKLGDHEAIEIIGDEEFEYDHVGKNGVEILKKKAQKQQANARHKRKQQKLVYQREIDNFNANQRRLLEKDRQNRTYWLTKKSEGILLENRVIFAHPHRREKLSEREIAMKDYLVEQMRLRQEEDTRVRKDKETVLKIAKRESKKWLDSKKLEIKKGMGVYEEREKEFGPSFRNAVKAAQQDPAMYSRIIQQSLFEPKDKPERFVKHMKYNSNDSDDGEAWQSGGYIGSPMGSTDNTWRLGGENRKTIYDVTHWKRKTEIEDAGKKYSKAPKHSSISSEFARQAPAQVKVFMPPQYSHNETDDEWEDDLYNGSSSPSRGIGTKTAWGHPHISRRSDKTIYDITRWKRISDPATAEEMKHKTGHNSITADFVRNSAPQSVRRVKNSKGQESDSEWEDDFNGGSPARSMATKDSWNRQDYNTPQRRDKTIYDITGWSRISDGETAARSNQKKGHSSITSNFVKNAGMPYEGEFSRKPSHRDGQRFGRNKHDDDEEALYQGQLRQSVLAARIEKEHELQSYREYERQREIERGMVLGSFDTRKETKYVEKILDAERVSNKIKLQNMFQDQYGLI